MSSIEVRDSDVHGLGVFATRDIVQGEILCTCPGLYIPTMALTGNILEDYYFESGAYDYHGILAVGPISFLNRAEAEGVNCRVVIDEEDEGVHATCLLVALRDISKGEEIFLDYDNYDRADGE